MALPVSRMDSIFPTTPTSPTDRVLASTSFNKAQGQSTISTLSSARSIVSTSETSHKSSPSPSETSTASDGRGKKLGRRADHSPFLNTGIRALQRPDSRARPREDQSTALPSDPLNTLPKSKRLTTSDRTAVPIRNGENAENQISVDFQRFFQAGNKAFGDGKFDDALPPFQQALNLKPHDTLLNAKLGEIFLNQNKDELALRHLKTAQRCGYRDEKLNDKIVQAYMQGGTRLLKTRQYQDAIEKFQSANILDKNNPIILAYLGVCYGQSSDYTLCHTYLSLLKKNQLFEPDLAQLVYEAAFRTAEYFAEIKEQLYRISNYYEIMYKQSMTDKAEEKKSASKKLKRSVGSHSF